MTFIEWDNQSQITFDQWFIQEWNCGWLRTDEEVSKYIIKNLQEENCQIKHDVLKDTYISIFKIHNRFFRIKWFKIYDDIHVSPIEEVQKVRKSIEIEYYIPI